MGRHKKANKVGRVPKKGVFIKEKEEKFSKKIIFIFFTTTLNLLIYYNFNTVSGFFYTIEFINFHELRKNVYRVSEVLAHIWKGGDRGSRV